MATLLNTITMHPRDQITLVMKRIYDRVLTTTSGGNLSICDEDGNIWITPAGMDKGLLKPADIVCVKRDGSVIGEHKPSSEYPFHQAIYKKRPDIKAVIHAHPPGIVAFSIVRKVPDTRVLPQVHALCGAIGYAPYALPGSEALGKNIAAEFGEGASVVVMENHGTVIGGTDISEAYQKFELMECTAKSLLHGSRIGTAQILAETAIEKHLKQFCNALPEEDTSQPYSVINREKRTALHKIITRACRQGLMLGAYGSVSVRWEENDFIITPDHISKWDLTPGDMVQIRNGEREKGKIPDKTVQLHQAIYKQHKDINAVIITQPVYLTAFAITGENFNVRTIPETWIYLQDVQMIEQGCQFSEDGALLPVVSAESPVMIIKNECVVVTGNKLLQAFDYLEVAEFSAKSLILSASLGTMIPIEDREIEALGKVMSRWKNYEWKI
ncbi:class II aldolase/adducin family protein [Niabella drilacis]|uniref:L-fuculose-phosphate aldolase n=1 Tax=Niabella drilacis (strain DSM 25811 / CCM 8410 / CCUG 62505 / LMG 26954 / E90) TaxID=1285928 RepID=A0A1G6JHZ0_NIADE|nr:class II aldolase/adducin family protein [Niabella drilacis]SDC18065.1 L-fuculose-phosphate aldolase [Niabella drilacis]